MKLFVWYGDGVLVDYTSGQVVSIAPDLATAHVLINAHEGALGLDAVDYLPAPSDVIDIGDAPGVTPRAWVTWGGG